MEIDIPDLDDLKFVNRDSWDGTKRLTPVGERLIDFLKSIGVPIVKPEGWRDEEEG